MRRQSRLLIIDDQATLARNIERYMAKHGYDVRSTTSGEGGLVIAEDFWPDIAVVDFRLPGLNGLGTVARLHALQPELQIVMVTGHGDPALEQQAALAGAYKCLTKPVALSDLRVLLDRMTADIDLDRVAPVWNVACHGAAASAGVDCRRDPASVRTAR